MCITRCRLVITLLLSHTLRAWDECTQYHSLDSFESYCMDSGKCFGSLTGGVDCLYAYTALPRPGVLPEIVPGLLSEPVIDVGSVFSGDVPEFTEESRILVTSLKSPLRELIAKIRRQSPRIIYRHLDDGPVLAELMRNVTWLPECSETAEALEDLEEMIEFFFMIADAADVVMMVSSPSPYVAQLVPYLHFIAAVEFKHKLAFEFMGEFWKRNRQLVLTISQFDPRYCSDKTWRFRITGHQWWMYYPSERPLLGLPWDRTSEPRILDEDMLEDLADSVEAVFDDAENVHDLPVLIQEFADVVHAVYVGDGHLSNAGFSEVTRICQLSQFLAHCWAEGLKDMRFRTNLLTVCGKDSIFMETRIAAFTQYTPTRYADVELISQPIESFVTAVECTTGSQDFLPHIGREWTSLVLSQILHALARDWIGDCLTAAVAEMVSDQGGLKDNTTEDQKRGLGILMALALDKGQLPRFEGQNDLYFESEAVKKGFYTVFAWDSFELMFDYPEDLAEITRIILSDQY
jgi:hypothetical protein